MEELNKILLRAVPNAWAKQSYLQGWYFELNTYRETCAIFERIEVAERLLKHPLGQNPTVTLMSGNERDEKPPRLPTLRRAALAS